jgi:hypothetical protein
MSLKESQQTPTPCTAMGCRKQGAPVMFLLSPISDISVREQKRYFCVLTFEDLYK